MATRRPIVTVLGHVDHGKSSILDRIRGTAVVAREAGGITQAIGCSIVPLKTIQTICGSLLNAIKSGLTIPGLLFIDSPGHAAFTSLRKRGGSLADIAILVVDINEGFKPQTTESIEILKA
ncbi:MAG: GTP-binding protein, partial [Nanoarchaeota archaeon]